MTLKRFKNFSLSGVRQAAAAVLLATSLAGCFGCGGGGSTTIPEVDSGGDKMTLTLTAGEKLNTCGGDVGRALVVKVYQLRSDSRLSIMSLAQFWDNEQTELADDFIDAKEVVLDPGAQEEMELVTLPEIKFLAVVGNFCETQGDCWRWIRPVDDMDKKTTLTFGEFCVEAN